MSQYASVELNGLCLVLSGSDIESALERLLGKEVKPAELAHVDMRTKLGQAGLDHFMDLPQLWPPSLAVAISVLVMWLDVHVVCFAFRCASLRPE